MHQFEREATQTSTSRACACRKPGQRLKKTQRRKLQQQFIDTFGALGNVKAMEHLGLSRYTLYCWLKDPEFKQRYDEKLASYQLTSGGELTDEEWEWACNYWRMQPAWKIIQRMKLNERMAARRGEPHNIWW